jgi:diacylglycerol kinase (ATP)
MSKNNTFRNIFKVRGFRNSLAIACKGIIYLFLYHRNMRLIFLVGILAFLAGVILKLKGLELAVLCITITLVFMAEIFNTAIELLLDAVTEQYHTKIKIIKDIAAGVVVLSCLNAIAIGCALFLRKI